MRPRITGAGLLACLLAFLNMSGCLGDITGQACFAQTATPVVSPPATRRLSNRTGQDLHQEVPCRHRNR